VPDQRQVLEEIKQLLAPGGRLFFVEHVAAHPGTCTRVVQDSINPVYTILAGGCNCNRDTLQVIESVFGHRQVQAWEVNTGIPLIGRIHVGFVCKAQNTNL
jgi:hypothetical protein